MEPLFIYKPPIKVRAYTPGEEIKPPKTDTIRIVFDPEYFRGLLDAVHDQKYKIQKLGLTPKYVCMSYKTYEQMLAYHYNQTRSVSEDNIFGLTPVVSSTFRDYEVEVQCTAKEEMLYREELSKARYGEEGQG